MDAALLSALAGALLSLLCSYLPGVRDWFQGLGAQPDGAERKRLVMLGLLALAALGAYALACAGWGPAFGLSLSCDEAGALALARAFLAALVSNQGVYALSPRPQGRPA